jgi:hypothetical protein
MWKILSDILPGFREIDYHGRLEIISQISSYIVTRIIERPDITGSDLKDELDNIPENFYEETMYYLERANIFKAFSMLGVFPEWHYYNGELLKYDHPIMAYYERGSIKYFDKNIIDIILPDPYSGDKYAKAEREAFKREARAYREITRAEEIRLARQLEYGNKAAEFILVGSNLGPLPKLAKRIKKHLDKLFGSKYTDSISEEDLFSEAQTIMLDLVRKYARLGTYEYIPLKEYLQKRLNPRVYTKGFQIIKEMRHKSSNESIFEAGKNGGVSLEDLMTEEAVGASRLEEQESIEVLGRLLTKTGFNNLESEIIILFVFEGYDYRDMVEYFEERDVDDILDEEAFSLLIEKFREKFQKIDRETLKNIFSEDIPLDGVADKYALNDNDQMDSELEIKKISFECRQVIDRIKDIHKKLMISDRLVPVDIIVDISLLHKDDLEENMETWAYLILSCSEFQNVNFIFKKPDFAGDGSFPEALRGDIENAPQETDLLIALMDFIKEKGDVIKDRIDIDSLISKRINQPQREDAIAVPIVSELWLKWIRGLFQGSKININDALKNNYPIAVEELTLTDKGIALRNFAAALNIGLAKAYLAMLVKSKDDKYSHFRDRVGRKIDLLYADLRKDVEKGDIDAGVIDAMVSNKPVTRLNISISLSIPKILRKALKILKKEHDIVQLFLQSA